MLTLFRNNQISNALLLAVYTVLLHLPALLSADKVPVITADAGVAAAPILQFFVDKPVLGVLFAALLLWIQGLSINFMCNNFRIDTQRTFYTGLFYVLTGSLLKEYWNLSPQLLATTFLIIAFSRLFNSYKSQNRVDVILDSSLAIMVGALFYPPVVYLLFPAFIGVGMLRSFQLKERLIFLTGAGVIFFLAWLYFFWNDSLDYFYEKQIATLGKFLTISEPLGYKYFISLGFLGLFVASSLFNFGSFTSRKLIQVQKYTSILYWFFFCIIGFFFLQSNPGIQYFFLLTPCLGIFLAFIFLSIKNKPIAELLHFAIVMLIFLIHYFPI